MLLSRFWYIVLSALLAMVLFLLYLATAVTNRDAHRTAGQLLTAASKATRWYITDDARNRAGALVPLALDSDVRKGLAKASKAATLEEVDSDVRADIKSGLRQFREKKPGGVEFDVLWAVDVYGRVIANENYEQGTSSEHFEMGGYSLVADALHGWIRDDSWILDGRILRVVAHPVETSAGSAPVGAIVGGKWVDDKFAQDISDSTGAAVAFYANATRIATGAPVQFDKSALEVHTADIEKLEENENYQEKGRTAPMLLRKNDSGFDTTVVFTRMPGEAWDLGAGYVVGHRQATVTQPLEFQKLANESDKEAVPLLYLILVAVAAALVGLILTLIEHTMPLSSFRRSTSELADKKSETDVLKPSTFRGTYKKIAQNINDALDKVASSAGIDRGPADLEKVLGPLPAQPQMSAFSVPKAPAGEDAAAASTPESEPRTVPKPKRALPKPPSRKGEGAEEPAAASPAEAIASRPAGAGDTPEPPSREPRTQDRPKPPSRPGQRPSGDASQAEPYDEESEWRKVYEDFVAMKEKMGEPIDKLTYEKFRGTLQRNKEALMTRHNCRRVKFRVYEKQGRAALKASPVQE